MADRTAFITGITGQDGSYLAELLLEKGCRVHGMVRRSRLEAAELRLARIRHLLNRVGLDTGSRESEILELRDDASPARRILGWKPAYDFQGLVNEWADAELAAVDEPTVA